MRNSSIFSFVSYHIITKRDSSLVTLSVSRSIPFATRNPKNGLEHLNRRLNQAK